MVARSDSSRSAHARASGAVDRNPAAHNPEAAAEAQHGQAAELDLECGPERKAHVGAAYEVTATFTEPKSEHPHRYRC